MHTKYECKSYFDNLKIKLYLIKKGDEYMLSEKCLAIHVLEQIFNDKNKLISEKLNEL